MKQVDFVELFVGLFTAVFILVLATCILRLIVFGMENRKGSGDPD